MANSELKPLPQQPVLGAIAQFLKGVRSAGQAESWVPLIGGRNVAEFMLGRAPEEVENWSYGNAPFRMNPNTGVPGLKPGRGEPLADALFLAADVAPVVRGAGRLATRGMNAVTDAAVRGITGNPAATGPAVLQAAAEMSPLASVIKPKGGNWLTGTVEQALKPLKARGVTQAEAQEMAQRPTPVRMAAEGVLSTENESINRWLDQKLTRYIKNEMATPEDPVRLQADRWADEQAELLAAKDAQIAKARSDMERARAERGFTPEMMTRSQAAIRDLEKQRELIAARLGLHFEPQNTFSQQYAVKTREKLGYPPHGMGKSRTASDWESLADGALDVHSAKDVKRVPDLSAINSWIEKVPDDALVYDTFAPTLNEELGFGHIVDELRNALNPNSGLPKELLLDPKTLDKMTVPQAVQLVDRINAHRAVQKAEADIARASNAATVEHKTYDVVPGTAVPNERGLRWVELKQPSNETMPLEERKALIAKLREEGGNPETWPREMLEDALKYEADQLQHCVGGYCDEVAEGRSRIFSLRDASGKPHVTIEVTPQQLPDKFSDLWDVAMKHVDEDAPGWDVLYEYGDEPYELFFERHGKYPDDPRAVLEEILDYFPEAKDKTLADLESVHIAQIKGKGNKAPADDVLPFVQDFVRSGEWSYVGDLQNAKLYRVTPGQRLPGFSKEIEPGYYTLEDFQKMAAENEMPQDILETWMSKLKSTRDYGYAAGGLVGGADQKMAEGGLVGLAQRYDEGGPVERLKRFARAARPEFLHPAITEPVGEAAREVAGNLKLAVTDPRAALTNIARNMQSSFEANPTEWAMNWTGGGLGSMPLAGVIKNKGGNWLAGRIEDAIGRLKQAHVPDYARWGEGAAGVTDQAKIEAAAVGRWLDTKLTKYVKNEMGTPEDPIRLLADRGIIHQEQAPLDTRNMRDIGRVREAAGFPSKGLAQTRLGQEWEAAADSSIVPSPADAWLYEPYLSDNPWLAKVPPETPVHLPTTVWFSPVWSSQGNKFGHLVDELRNALDTNSGLPRELQLTPAQLEKVTVPQAVERVAKINEWRAAQKAEADLVRANNAATVVHKEYPTVPNTELPNEKGLRWVELKQPSGETLPEGYSLSTITNENLPAGHMGRNSYAVVDPQGRMLEDVGMAYTEADALDKFKRSYHGRILEDALKYEGDVMGHCVGGYCNDVMAGRSRIFSLRDAKGQPHVTVEVAPGEGGTYTQNFRHWAGQEGYNLADPADLEHAKAAFAAQSSNLPSIIQIKGKGNNAPKDEYLPFVQDFVKSGQWSQVGDARNAGLRKFTDVFSSNELHMLEKAGAELPTSGYLTGEDIQRLHDLITPEGRRLKYDARGNVIDDGMEGYASGGLVGLHAKYAGGGAVKGLAKLIGRSAERERAFDRAMNYSTGLSAEEKGALHDYVRGFNAGDPQGHATEINDLLTAGGISDRVLLLDEILRRAPKTETPLTVYRGMMAQEDYSPRFSSASIHWPVAKSYADPRMEQPGRAALRLQLPSRTPLVAPDVYQLNEEGELLLPRGLRFQKTPTRGEREVVLPKKYAAGGAVTTTEYDPAAIDALVNEIMESEHV